MSVVERTVLRLLCDACDSPSRDVVELGSEVRGQLMRAYNNTPPPGAAEQLVLPQLRGLALAQGWSATDGKVYCVECCRKRPNLRG